MDFDMAPGCMMATSVEQAPEMPCYRRSFRI